MQRSSSAGMMAGDRLEEISTQARALIVSGRGKELLLMPGWWYVITAESFIDRLEKTPDVLELAPQVTCPTLFIRGDQEPRDSYPAEEFAQRARCPVRIEIIPHCDHFYNGREQAIQEQVISWLANLTAHSPPPPSHRQQCLVCLLFRGSYPDVRRPAARSTDSGGFYRFNCKNILAA